MILSYLGEVSLGQTVFWAAGAYVTAILVLKSGWSPLPALAASLVASLVIAVVLGLGHHPHPGVRLLAGHLRFGDHRHRRRVQRLAVRWDPTDSSAFRCSSLPVIGGKYVAFNNAAFWPIAYMLPGPGDPLRGPLPSFAARRHIADDAHEPRPGDHDGRRRPPHPGAGVHAVRPGERAGRLALRLPAQLRQPGPALAVLPAAHAHGGDPARQAAAARPARGHAVLVVLQAELLLRRRCRQHCAGRHPRGRPADLARRACRLVAAAGRQAPPTRNPPIPQTEHASGGAAADLATIKE